MDSSHTPESRPETDPMAAARAAERHSALAAGLLALPNLVLRSALTLVLLYGLLTLVLITVVQFGFLQAEFAVIIGTAFAVLQFTVGPWIMDLTLRWLYTM